MHRKNILRRPIIRTIAAIDDPAVTEVIAKARESGHCMTITRSGVVSLS